MSTEKTKLSKNNKDVILGIATLVFAAIYFFLTLSLPRTEGVVDSRFVPFLLCTCLTIIGFFQIWLGIQKSVSTKKSEKIDKSTLLKTVAVTIMYILLYEPIGFIIMTFIYLLLQMSILTPTYARKNYVLYTVIAACTSLGVYCLFYYAFNIFLPKGILYGII
ncbi:tripartite tricarboxylate transporter TctB family protein [Tepidanaerobacter sp. GT38]|mgnify:CR=1 FL=1|uniref:tripartite tricarboxylate transporter TctB family protein n=1 Tax=Tepidanaerobacter sp. GT38 TaxID=2722793 RepID=UPI001F39677C|nr:tripartite tricarboxylate transporter TctB family protein [Tepidanaerobacter sp. GT38]MCG1013104.1 tripartite tricarboxylate transporter TctB family protein [Tepidanaerobacter sp. GT38]